MKRRLLDYSLMTVISFLLVVASARHWIPYGLTETLGFVTGAACVYLVIRQDVWNFPVGIANNIFFLVLFGQARLFGDASLQIVYVALGLQGWYLWLYGGHNRSRLEITHVSIRTVAILSTTLLVSSTALAFILWRVRGSIPVLDSLTTVLSLIAQYMLNKKYFENWYVWIAADLIYIYLYLVRELQLTALLYFAFLLLCILGLRSWRQALDQQTDQSRLLSANSL